MLILVEIFAKHTFELQGQKMILDGKPYHMLAGELHYPRIPHQYWRHRIQMAKAMGLNTVSMYVFWNYHEQTEGVFDFESPQKNVTRFIEICEEEGMVVALRPGPYVCAEWDFGGIPTYLLQNATSRIRTVKDEHFKLATERFFRKLVQVVKPQFVSNGGVILMIQFENEYASWPQNRQEKEYITFMKELYASLNVNVPYYTADGAYQLTNVTHCEGCILGLNAPVILDKEWENAHKFDPNVPVFASELYPGLLRRWGESNWAIRNASVTVDQAMNRTVSGVDIRGFCFYMAHGGTNFGFTAGAHKLQSFRPLVTSYNQAAPIDEAGRPTQMFYEYRDIIYKYTNATKPPVPEQIKAISINNFTVTKTGSLMAQNPDFVQQLEKPQHLEHFLQNQGIIVYSTMHKKSKSGLLKFAQLHDIGYVYLNKTYIGTINTYQITNNKYEIVLPETQQDQLLEIIIDTFGHVNYGIEMEADRKGIYGDVSFEGDKNYYSNWTHTSYNLRNFTTTYENKTSTVKTGNIYTGSFTIDSVGDTFLNTTSLNRGMLWVNDINLGRYWDVGPQRCLFIPGVFLKKGENKVVVLEMYGEKQSYNLFGVQDGCL